MHVGHPGHVDIRYTVTRKRRIDEMLSELPADAPERAYFVSDAELRSQFPSGEFNCWGVPPRAEPAFRKTEIGDLVLFAPWIGIHDGGIHHLGIVKAKCPDRALIASQVLWPDTPHDRLYPWLFFFDTETGNRPWFEFLSDLGYKDNWQPRGWYRRLADPRFRRWGGPQGYLDYLRTKAGFINRDG